MNSPKGNFGKTSRKLKTKRREGRERPGKSTTPETARKTERSRDGNNRKEEEEEEGKKVGGGEKKAMKKWKSQI
jgi:hypothetical protein